MSKERVQLRGVAETLLITVYLRACDARSRRPVLGDPYAADVVEHLDYDFTAFARGRGNAPLTAARALQLDRWTQTFLATRPDGQVLHLGCGLDSRPLRLAPPATSRWVDIDQPAVIDLRRRLYDLPAEVTQLGASVTDPNWWNQIDPQRPTLLVAEGLLMYLSHDEVHTLLDRALNHLPEGWLAFDAVAGWMVTLSRHSTRLQRAGIRFSWPLDDLKQHHPLLRAVDDISLMNLLAGNPKISSVPRAAYAGLAWLPPIRNALRLQRFRFSNNRRQ